MIHDVRVLERICYSCIMYKFQINCLKKIAIKFCCKEEQKGLIEFCHGVSKYS